MEDNSQECSKILKTIKARGKHSENFESLIKILKDEAHTNGLNDECMNLIIEILINGKLNASMSISLIRCMIPRRKIDDETVKLLISWFFTKPVAVTILNTLLQWLIGCWEYQLVNRNSIYIFYDPFFFVMLKEESFEKNLARLIYLTTRPEDISRRQVQRLLKFNETKRRPCKHIIALVSLFKSYKPEVVPEKIQAISIQSTWHSTSEDLLKSLEHARDRIALEESSRTDLFFNWNIFEMKKKQEPIVAPIKYIDLTPSLLRNKTEISVFEISNMLNLAKNHFNVKLPNNSTSLLSNVIGHHLLTYAGNEYQRWFTYNLYFTLWRIFIKENGKYSDDEINKVLDMITEFFKYMQHGIPLVNCCFINDYLSNCEDRFFLKLLSIIEWSSVSPLELKNYILKHLKSVFYISPLDIKCEIIKTLKALLLNLFIINDDTFKEREFPFLKEPSTDEFNEYVTLIESFTSELVISALNIYNYNLIVVSEALSFYEQINTLKMYKNTSFAIILAPPAVIYGCFITKSCALLSRLCALLLDYRKYFIGDHANSAESMRKLITYAEDLISVLWYDNCFSNRLGRNRYFLKNISDDAIQRSMVRNIDCQMNIFRHCAMLPYIYTLKKGGIQIKTKKDANNVVAQYYCYINQFINVLVSD